MKRRRKNPDGVSVVGGLAVVGVVALGAWALFGRRRPTSAVRMRQQKPIPAMPTAEQAAMIDLISSQQLRELGYPTERYYNDPIIRAMIDSNPSGSSNTLTPAYELAARNMAFAAWRQTHPELEGRSKEAMQEALDREYAVRFGLPL